MRRPDSAGSAHGWALGWAGQGRGARLRGTRFGRSSLSARAPALAAATASAAASTSPLRLRRLCHRRRRAPARAGALNAARGLPAKPGPDSTLPPPSSPPPPQPRLPSLLPPPPARRSSGHLDAAGSEAGAAATAPQAPRALTRSAQAELPSAPRLHLFFCNFTKNKRTSPVL